MSGTAYLSTFVPTEDRERLAGVFRKIVLGGKAATNENRIMTRSGETFLVEWHGRTVARTGNGAPGFFVGVGTDITARKKADDALRESEERYRRLHESMRDCFAQADMTGKIVSANRAFQEMLGYGEGELKEKSYWDITPACWHEKENDIIGSQVLTRGYSDVYEKEYVRADGSVVPVELRAYQIGRASCRERV